MTDWERIELRPLFQRLAKEAPDWDAPKVLPRTQNLGHLVLHQLKNYEDGKYRADRNECRGFFESIDKFVKTGLPISLDHFQDLLTQYQSRITPYPHYSGIKLTVPKDFSELDNVSVDDIPDIEDQDESDDNASLKLM